MAARDRNPDPFEQDRVDDAGASGTRSMVSVCRLMRADGLDCVQLGATGDRPAIWASTVGLRSILRVGRLGILRSEGGEDGG
ncbi:hypothetical protein [uncultured Methylobacterium sp.]|uniref:hypothetical protein n=1 Tax=uncultured Methylobacterium sp. TaxID=157278 RepID=UPI002588D6DE|nr:hypothetical protein [uncultured Methylobacterium sp.]